MTLQPISIRASSLPGLFDCPARFEATQLLGLHAPTSGKAILGRAVHASTAVYDVARLNGDYDLTPDEAAGAAVDAIHKPQEDVVWDESLNPDTAEKIALGLHGLYCVQIAPAAEYVAVEATCKALTITDLGLTLTGTVDRVYKAEDDTLGIADIKTGGRAVAVDGTVETAGHAYQVAVYELLAGQALDQPMTAPARIIGLQAGKTPRGQRAGIGRIEGAKQTLVGDEKTPGVLELAAKMLHSGTFFGNPKSMMCHARYCPRFSNCFFRR